MENGPGIRDTRDVAEEEQSADLDAVQSFNRNEDILLNNFTSE